MSKDGRRTRYVTQSRHGAQDGAKGIQKHAWFSGFNWKALLHGKMEGPIKIKTKGADDASNFEDYPDDLPTPGNSAEIAENDQA